MNNADYEAYRAGLPPEERRDLDQMGDLYLGALYEFEGQPISAELIDKIKASIAAVERSGPDLFWWITEYP